MEQASSLCFPSKEAKAFRNALRCHHPWKRCVDPKLKRQVPFPVTRTCH